MIPVHIWGLKLPAGTRYLNLELAELNNEPFRFHMPLVHEPDELDDLPNLVIDINSEILKAKGLPNVHILFLDSTNARLSSEKIRECCLQVIQFAYFCTKSHILFCDLTGPTITDEDSSQLSSKVHQDLRRLTAQWSCYASYIDLFEVIQPNHWVNNFKLGRQGQEVLAKVINRTLLGTPTEVFIL